MQDNLSKIMREAVSLSDQAERMINKLAPEVAKINANAPDMDPELKGQMDAALGRVSELTKELKDEKKKFSKWA